MIHWKQSGTACRPMGKAARPHCAGEEMNVKNRILVIEDEVSISELICMNLGIGGYEARPLYTGREVLELLEEEGGQAGDLALVDVMLPDRDGKGEKGFKLPKYDGRFNPAQRPGEWPGSGAETHGICPPDGLFEESEPDFEQGSAAGHGVGDGFSGGDPDGGCPRGKSAEKACGLRGNPHHTQGGLSF